MKGFYISLGNPACKRLEANQKCICIFRATPSVAGNIILHDYKFLPWPSPVIFYPVYLSGGAIPAGDSFPAGISHPSSAAGLS